MNIVDALLFGALLLTYILSWIVVVGWKNEVVKQLDDILKEYFDRSTHGCITVMGRFRLLDQHIHNLRYKKGIAEDTCKATEKELCRIKGRITTAAGQVVAKHHIKPDADVVNDIHAIVEAVYEARTQCARVECELLATKQKLSDALAQSAREAKAHKQTIEALRQIIVNTGDLCDASVEKPEADVLHNLPEVWRADADRQQLYYVCGVPQEQELAESMERREA